MAALMDFESQHRGEKIFDTELRRGTRVNVKLVCAELDIEEPVESVVWRGAPAFCQFVAHFPENSKPKTCCLPSIFWWMKSRLAGSYSQ